MDDEENQPARRITENYEESTEPELEGIEKKEGSRGRREHLITKSGEVKLGGLGGAHKDREL